MDETNIAYNPDALRGRFKDWARYLLPESFIEGFDRQVESDEGLAEKLGASGLHKPLSRGLFNAFIDGYVARALEANPDLNSARVGYQKEGFDAAWPLQRFRALIPTDTRGTMGDTLYFNLYDLGVRVASLSPFSR